MTTTTQGSAAANLSTGLFAVPRRFLHATRAAAAVEFALIVPPFVAILLSILQLGVVMIAQEVLQTATNQAARLIMTGQAQTSNMTSAQFHSKVCTNAAGLFSCPLIYVNVQTFATFTSVNTAAPVTGGNLQTTSMKYVPGGNGDIVVVQSFYPWPVIPGPLNFNFSNLNGNKLLLVATAAFRNEPY